MKSYFRFLSRNKLYTLINIAGLVVSLMFIILMGDYTWRQYSIDSWHKNADRIYLTGNEKMFYMWPQAAEEIKNQCPEVSNQNKNRAESISFWLDFAQKFFVLSAFLSIFANEKRNVTQPTPYSCKVWRRRIHDNN